MKRTIVLCDPDREYGERIAEFARNSSFRKEAEITVCSRAELFAAWWREGKFDVYVASVEVADSLGGSSAPSRPVVWIGETAGASGPGGAAIASKYESAPKLLRAWLDRAEPSAGDRGSSIPAIVGIWSAAGGVGKTKLIGYMADAWGRRGIRTFVAGFDPGGDAGCGDRGTLHDVSDWLYGIKSGRMNEVLGPGFDAGSGPHAFSPLCSYREWAGIGRSEAEALLKAAAACVGDGIVLADAGTGWSPWAEAVWGRSETILCVVAEETSVLAKTEKWLNDWPEWEENGAFRAKTRFVINRCLNESSTGSDGWRREAFRLPYVPEWKQRADRNDPVFQRAAERLSEEVRAGCTAR